MIESKLKPYIAQFTAGSRYMVGQLIVEGIDDNDARKNAEAVIEMMNSASQPKHPFILNGVWIF